MLDLGAGKGHMASRLSGFRRTRGMDFEVIAVDFQSDAFNVEDVPYVSANLNNKLPFPDGTADFIYGIEVIEHLENIYGFVSECHRILKPGGRIFLTTPNILNIASRFRFLAMGLPEIYEYPSAEVKNAGRLCGHISPVSLFYIDLAFRKSNFSEISYCTDKFHPGSLFWYFLLRPLWVYFIKANVRRLKGNDVGLALENERSMRFATTKALLAGRNLIAMAQKNAR